ncbi:MAG: peptidoglycan DD-metalloendopeptidase family protein [Pseudomonadota bacterium]
MRPVRHVLAALLIALPAAAQDAGFDTDRAATLLDRAATALAGAGSADDEMAALGRAVRAYEIGLAAQREALRSLATRDAALTAQLDADRARAARLLGALQTVERTPPGLMLLHPDGPLAAAQSAHVMGTLSPRISADVARIVSRQEDLRAVRSEREAALDRFQGALTAARAARARLDGLMRARVGDPDIGALAVAAQLRADAASLQSLARALRQDGEAPTEAAFAVRRGTLPPPVIGRVLRRFGSADAGGFVRDGIVVGTDSLALVTAPAAGTVRYAGPFLDYGAIVILEPEAGFLLTLAGLAGIAAEVGDVVSEGAPLGYVGEAAAGSEDFLIETDRDTRPNQTQSLYIELRQAGEPIDPEPWFVFVDSGDSTE